MTARAVRRGLSAAALALALAGALAPRAAEQVEKRDGKAPPRVLTLTIDGAITGGAAEYVEAALERAEAEGFAAIAITLDTPGGLLDATRDIVKAMLASRVPTLVWVGPAGAHAASAGVFITVAADFAAMHPTSNIGAAHPVTGGGRDVEAEAGKDMAKKVENDAVAFVRSVAEGKGRNADWVEKAVRESVAVTATEAVKLRVVEATAIDVAEALEKADGRGPPKAEAGRVLHVKGAIQVPYEKTVRQRLLSFLSDPNVLAILTLIGTLGIAIEFYNPGLIVPGVLGVLALFLAFLGMRVIPVNVGAVILVLVGVALLVVEGFVTTHGLAGTGGVACLVLGMLFFVDRSSPDYQFDPGALSVSPWVVWPTPIVLGLLLGLMAWNVARSRRAPLQLGAPALVGERGEALSAIGPQAGEAFVHGEYWQARSGEPIPQGARVRVTAVDGLVVTVVAEG
jgi:membrane-bound serine protease (ClpP class)